jgi:hypothetical protein
MGDDMPLLRLKRFTQDIFTHYLHLADEPTESEENTALGKKLRASYSMTCQTVLFFNQSVPDMALFDWCQETPLSYQLEIDHFIGLLEDSTRWAISAIGMGEGMEPESLKERLIVDVDNYRIATLPDRKDDAVTAQFEKTCNLIHEEVPLNLRKRKALVRLIWAYICAKDLTAMARELSSCDRVEYLRRLTKY